MSFKEALKISIFFQLFFTFGDKYQNPNSKYLSKVIDLKIVYGLESVFTPFKLKLTSRNILLK